MSWYQDEYLTSDHWRTVRAEALLYAGYACQVCNSEHRLNVHHRTYERVGREEPADLTVLCEDCHQRFHDKMPSPPTERPTAAPRRRVPEHTLLRVMVHHPEWRARVIEAMGVLSLIPEPERDLFTLLGATPPDVAAADLLRQVQGPAQVLLAELLDEGWSGIDVDRTVEAEINSLHARAVEAEQRDLARRLPLATDRERDVLAERARQLSESKGKTKKAWNPHGKKPE